MAAARGVVGRGGEEEVGMGEKQNEVLKAHEDALYKLQRAVYAMTECSLTRQTTMESFFPKQKKPEPLMESMEVD